MACSNTHAPDSLEEFKIEFKKRIQFSTNIRAFQYKTCSIDEVKLHLENDIIKLSDIMLDEALSEGCNVEVLKFLLEKGAQIKDLSLYSAVSSSKCNFEVIKFLLERGAKLEPKYILSRALLSGCSSEVIKLFLENGAKLSSRIVEEAMCNGHCNIEVIKLLLDCGAVFTENALQKVFRDNDQDIIQMLINRATISTKHILIKTVVIGATNAIKVILKNNIELDSQILKIAVVSKSCNSEIIKLLLDKGALITGDVLNIVVETKNKCNLETIKLLLEHGASVSIEIFEHSLIYSSDINVPKLLLQYLLIELIKDDQLIREESLLYQTFLKLKCVDSFVYQQMFYFFNCLKKDLLNMKKDKISQDSTLFSFVSDHCTSALILREVQDSHVEEVLLTYQSRKYVSCQNLLYTSITKNNIISKICTHGMCVKKKVSIDSLCDEKVSMNYFTIFHLGSFLTKSDCVNLMLAFWPKNENKKIIKY